MMRRFTLISSIRYSLLFTLLLLSLYSHVLAEDSINLSLASISTIVAPLDAAAMGALCSDQIGMCTVSCQNKIQQNSCNAKSLEWTCICKNGTRSTFGDWQLPVPFQLCRRQLSSCLQYCISSQQQRLDREQKKKSSKTLRKRKMDGDFPHQKGDYKHKEEMIVEEEEKLADSEVVDEFQFVRHYARLYATFFRNKKPKHQENQQQNIQTQHVAHSRTKQKADKHRRAMDLSTLRVAINEDNNRTPLLTVYSVDPPVPREPICASQCGRLFSCGTRSAPEYRNIEDYLSTDDNPDGSKDNTTAIMMDKNQNKAFLGSRHNGVKSRGEWIMTRFVTVMASIAMAQCVS